MNLAIDLGNSQTKFGLFEKDELKEVFSGNSIPEKMLSGNKIMKAIISETGSDNVIKQQLKEKKIDTLFVSSRLKLPIEIIYQTPETLGSDRIAGSVAANYLFPGRNVLKIDFGTCITYDFVNDKSQYLGGSISAGMVMRFKALHDYTAKLPLIELDQFNSPDLIGIDTATSILSGVVNGIKEEAEGIINEYRSRFGSLNVAVTGGDAGLFATLVKSEIFARPYLVLEGLNRILNYNL